MEPQRIFGVITMTSAKSLIITPVNEVSVPPDTILRNLSYFEDDVGDLWVVIEITILCIYFINMFVCLFFLYIQHTQLII